MDKQMGLRNRLSRMTLSWPVGLLIFVAAFAAVVLINPSTSYLPDVRQVIYRYTEQLRVGHGLVFNPNERTLLVPAPLFMLLSAFVGFASTLNVVVVGQLLFALSLTLGAVSTFRILTRLQVDASYAVIGACIYCTGWVLWAGVGTAVPFASALCLVALDLGLSGSWSLAGIVAAGAILCSPETVIFAIVLTLVAVYKERAMAYGRVVFALVVVAVLVLWAYYGSSWWEGLLTLKDNAATTGLFSSISWLLTIPILVLAVWGWYYDHYKKHTTNHPKTSTSVIHDSTLVIAFCASFAVLYLLIIAGFLRIETSWRYAPLWGPILLLALVGLHHLPVPFAPVNRFVFAEILLGILSLIALLPILTIPLIRPTSNPIQAQAKKIGVGTTAAALRSVYFSSQSIIALDGQLQPDLKEMVERQDIQSMIIRYAPDVLILDDASRIRPEVLMTEQIKRLGYHSTDQANVFTQNSIFGEFHDLINSQITDKNLPATSFPLLYGPDIKLTSAAVDHSQVVPGQTIRVRLDWMIARPASTPITIDLWLRDGDYLVAHTTDTFDQSIFRAGTWSTYHTLASIPNTWAGQFSLEVGIIISSGTTARYPLTTITIIP